MQWSMSGMYEYVGTGRESQDSLVDSERMGEAGRRRMEQECGGAWSGCRCQGKVETSSDHF